MWLEYVILLFLGLFEISSSSTETWTSVNELSTVDIESQNIQPFFENTTQRSVIAAVGRTAQLHCKVRNLGDRAASHKVSWIRKRDLHILTIGIMTYTNDQRFQAMHLDDTDEWILKIVSVQPRDSGIYECQVSTEPKISQAYRLTVVVSKAKILANPELFFKSGSDINLTCIATQAPAPPSYIYWYKDGDLINYSQRGGINVLTERQTKTSKLVIARVVPSDSGNYTCTPSNSNSDSVYVHVIKSEHRAAMQHENSSKMIVPDLMWLNVLSLCFIYCYWYIIYDILRYKIIDLLQVTADVAAQKLQTKATASAIPSSTNTKLFNTR